MKVSYEVLRNANKGWVLFFLPFLWYWGLNLGPHACWQVLHTGATLLALFVLSIFVMGSSKLFTGIGFEPRSSWSLSCEKLGLQTWATGAQFVVSPPGWSQTNALKPSSQNSWDYRCVTVPSKNKTSSWLRWGHKEKWPEWRWGRQHWSNGKLRKLGTWSRTLPLWASAFSLAKW
jgi:hypothetical protein